MTRRRRLLQPAISAAAVLARGYGDCKDKSLLMVALLRELEAVSQPVDTGGLLDRGAASARVALQGLLLLQGAAARAQGEADHPRAPHRHEKTVDWRWAGPAPPPGPAPLRRRPASGGLQWRER